MTSFSFKSLVVMDLESSGLPAIGIKTKITELSFVGVLVDHVLESNKRGEGTPRVLQKVSLCFYPQKRIDFEATEITGLDNFLLEKIPSFDKEAVKILSAFLLRMPQPLCLVAHNGLKFDFQLLKAELAAKNEVLLPQEIFCVDSLLAFRALLPVTADMCKVADVARSQCITPIPENPVSDSLSILELQKHNETTPKQTHRVGCPGPLKRKRQETDENSPRNVRKNLFNVFQEGKPKSYKLMDLYNYICGREQGDGHQAECDSIALLECIVSTAPEFLRWTENNRLNFSTIPCMW